MSALSFHVVEPAERIAVRPFACRTRHRITISLAFGFCLIFGTPSALAQGLGQGVPITDPARTDRLFSVYDSAPGTGVVQLSVFSGNTHTPLDRQALIKLVNLQSKTAMWQTTEEGAKAIVPNVPFGNYSVEVSAVGYVTATQPVDLLNIARLREVSIILQKDPSAVQLDVDDTAVPSKGRKELKRAIAALKSNNLSEAQRHLEPVHALSPNNPEVNFLFGYLYVQSSDYDHAEPFLNQCLSAQPQNVQALVLLGRSKLERKDYRAAQVPLEKAIAIDGTGWLPHSLLADSYLQNHNDQGARDQAMLAIDKGNDAANSARLILGEALLNLGDDERALQALQKFVDVARASPLVPEVQRLIAEVQQRGNTALSPQPTDKTPYQVDALRAMPRFAVPANPWEPAGIDDLKPTVAPGVECPLAAVLQGSGDRVAQLVEDVSRFAAVEDLFHQRLDRYGVPIRTDSRKFNYVASIAEPEPGYLEVNEYRAEKLTLEGYPDHIASTGFATLAFVFHPDVRDDFEMRCEGLGNWQGLATWLVHFQQREDRPNRMHSYKMGSQIYPVSLKGRAWIRADNFEIVRLESELVKPMPQIQLLSEHQLVEYGPIQFGKSGTSLWLPKSAEIYFDFRHQRYYRRHSFDHYMLFAVNADEHRKEPTATAKPGAETVAPH